MLAGKMEHQIITITHQITEIIEIMVFIYLFTITLSLTEIYSLKKILYHRFHGKEFD